MSETQKFNFRADYFGTFVAKLEKLNKKLAKLPKFEEIKILKKEEYEHCTGEDAYLDPIYVPYYEIEVNQPNTKFLKLQGYAFLGTSINSEGNVTYNCSDASNRDKIITKDPLFCDHCNKSHKYRKIVNYFENDKKEVIGIGSSCSEKFFGVSIYKNLSIYEDFVSKIWIDEKDKTRSVNNENLIGFNMITRATLFVHKEHPIYEKVPSLYNNASETICTADRVNQKIIDLKKTPDEKLRKLILRTIENDKLTNIKELLSKEYNVDNINNDFAMSIKKNLFLNGEVRKSIPYKFKNILIYAIYSVLNKNVAEKKTIEKKNEFLDGKVGDKVQIKGKVTFVKTYENCYGYSKQYQDLHILETDKGTVKFYSTVLSFKKGDEIEIVGTIKDFKEYNKQKSTTLTRVKEFVPVDPKEEDAKKALKKLRTKINKSFSFPKSLEDLTEKTKENHAYARNKFSNVLEYTTEYNGIEINTTLSEDYYSRVEFSIDGEKINDHSLNVQMTIYKNNSEKSLKQLKTAIVSRVLDLVENNNNRYTNVSERF